MLRAPQGKRGAAAALELAVVKETASSAGRSSKSKKFRSGGAVVVCEICSCNSQATHDGILLYF